MAEAKSYIPSFDEIRSKTFESFGKSPCAWKVRVCEQVLHGDRDIISIAGTGMGKTLTFWMPLRAYATKWPLREAITRSAVSRVKSSMSKSSMSSGRTLCALKFHPELGFTR
jgi:hypothetical protein